MSGLRRDPLARCTVVVGEFDGMHLGHRHLVAAAAGVARRMRRPLVGVVLDDASVDERLTTIDDRMRALLASGCSAAMVVRTSTCHGVDRARPDRLVERIVELTGAQCAVLACLPGGADAARYPSLRDGFHRQHVEVVEVERQRDRTGRPITTGRIRDQLADGRVGAAAGALGRAYTIEGVVVRGAGLGRTIGFPTANVLPPVGRVIPAHGVYAGRVRIEPDREEHLAAINIGRRPTVTGGAGPVLVEAHLLDVDFDFYDATIAISFDRRLRPERRFASIDALVEQLARDVAAVARTTAPLTGRG